jgi:hypothetical protein
MAKPKRPMDPGDPEEQLLITIPLSQKTTFRVAAARKGTSVAGILRPILEACAQVIEAGREPVITRSEPPTP